jgi:DNA-binding response OmpR family regulator
MDRTVLSAKSILVVEDELLLCLDIARRLEDAGAKVFTAFNLQKALQLVEASTLSAGVLDFDLGNGDSGAVCWKLLERNNGHRRPSSSSQAAKTPFKRLRRCFVSGE